jgi:hypothetical protein
MNCPLITAVSQHLSRAAILSNPCPEAARPWCVGCCRRTLFSFLRDIAAQSGKPPWAEKTTVDIFHLDAIERICGDRCRYVCIVHHPLDVVCSLKDLGVARSDRQRRDGAVGVCTSAGAALRCRHSRQAGGVEPSRGEHDPREAATR